jgi:hypothetical protein
VYVNTNRYPMAPGNLEASEATPSAEITFEMLENSMATLQD